MRKHKRTLRLFALILSAVMLLSMIPVTTVVASEAQSVEEEYNTNLALTSKGVKATASVELSGYGPERAIDGECKPGKATTFNGYIAGHSNAESYFLKLEFPNAVPFNCFVIRHQVAIRPDQPNYNTKDFKVQISNTGADVDDESWTTIYTATGKNENVTSIVLDEAVTAKYVRIYITDGSQVDGETRARIGAFELYNLKEDEYNTNLALLSKGVVVTASSIHNGSEYYCPERAVDGETLRGKTASCIGWMPANGTTTPCWLTLEFPMAVTFNRWTVRHNGYGRTDEPNTYDAVDFELQTSEDGAEWKTVDAVTGNTENVTNITLEEAVTAKWVRLYITKGNGSNVPRIASFELYNTNEEYSPNIAVDATATASSQYAEYPASFAIDGIVKVGDTADCNGWLAGSTTEPHWLRLEFTKAVTFNRWVVRHQSAVRTNQTDYDTVDFELQTSEDGEEWKTVYAVADNTESVTDITLEEDVTTKWVRLYITDSNPNASDTRGRIGEFELYNMKKPAATIGETEYTSLQAAVDAATAEDTVKLVKDSAEEIVVAEGKTLNLDLNGKSLAKLTVNGSFYGMDSTTDDYVCGEDDYGKIGTIEGNYDKVHKTAAGKRYVAVVEDDGVSFHRFYVGVTHMALRPLVGGAGYTMTIAGDVKVQSVLDENDAYGYTVSVDVNGNEATQTLSGAKADFIDEDGDGVQKMDALTINKILVAGEGSDKNAEYAEMKIDVAARIKFEGIDAVEVSTASLSLKDIVEATDAALNTENLSDEQKDALIYMYNELGVGAMGWNIPNITALAQANVAE